MVADAKHDDPLAPVTVLVPNQAASVVVRRHLAPGIGAAHGVAGLFLSTVDRFAERLAAPLLAPRRPATRPILAAAWRSVLATEPGMFAAIREHQSTVTALVRVHRELRALDPTTLTQVSTGSRLADDTVRLHRRVQARVQELFYDETDLLRTATAHLRAGGPTAAELGVVVLYVPEDLSQPQLDLITTVGDVADLTIIAAHTGVQRPDRSTATALERFGAILDPAQPEPTASRVLHASDSDDEVRCVVREVLSALQSVPAHRLGVLYAASSPYARLLHDHLTAAGIRHNGPGSRPTVERSIPHGIIRLLDALNRDLPRADLFEALSAARITLADGSAAPVNRWERISRLAGVVSGEDWDHRLDQYAQRERLRAVEERDKVDPSESRLAAIEMNIGYATGLRQFALELRQQARAAADLTWIDLSREALVAFHRYFGSPDELLNLPPEERNAARDVELALRSVASLAAFDPGTAGLPQLLDVLSTELEGSVPRVGRFGEGVFVGHVSAAVGLDLDVVYVLGLAEDLYPGGLHPEPLIAEPIRRASAGALRTPRDEVDTRHRHLLAAFSSAPTVVACFPRGNLRRSQPRLPSRWLMPTLRTLTGTPDLVASRWFSVQAPTIIESSSYATELEQTSLPATEQEWRTRAVRSGSDSRDPIIEAATAMITDRASTALSRYDGLVASSGLPDYTDGSACRQPDPARGLRRLPVRLLRPSAARHRAAGEP